MINYQFFPRSQGTPTRMREIIECFKKADEEKADEEKAENVQLKSNEMLSLLRPHLEKLHFKVEKARATTNRFMCQFCLMRTTKWTSPLQQTH